MNIYIYIYKGKTTNLSINQLEETRWENITVPFFKLQKTSAVESAVEDKILLVFMIIIIIM